MQQNRNHKLNAFSPSLQGWKLWANLPITYRDKHNHITERVKKTNKPTNQRNISTAPNCGLKRGLSQAEDLSPFQAIARFWCMPWLGFCLRSTEKHKPSQQQHRTQPNLPRECWQLTIISTNYIS